MWCARPDPPHATLLRRTLPCPLPLPAHCCPSPPCPLPRTIYNMCTQKPPHDYSEQLYNKYREAFTVYINERVS